MCVIRRAIDKDTGQRLRLGQLLALRLAFTHCPWIAVPFPNAPIAPIIQSPQCLLNRSNTAVPAASNAALEAQTHPPQPSSFTTFSSLKPMRNGNARKTHRTAARPSRSVFPISASKNEYNGAIPPRTSTTQHGHFGVILCHRNRPIIRARIAYTDTYRFDQSTGFHMFC